MSTRCRIGYVREDGKIESIYCHHDGYPREPGVGWVLKNHYTNIEDIKTLMSLGDISSLGNKPVSNPNAWEHPNFNPLIGDYAEWYKQNHPDDMCDTYASRGEDVPSEISETKESYKELTADCDGEYCYLFKDGKWHELFHSRM